MKCHNCFHASSAIIINLKMSKITRLLITVLLFSFVFGAWLFGSLLVIQIDSQQFKELKKFELLEKRNKDLRKHVDQYCRTLERKEIITETLASVQNVLRRTRYNDDVKKREALDAWDRARKEKIIRDNLIYFPILNEMWCLVPKAASTSWSRVIVDRLNLENPTLFVDPNSTDSLQVILRQNFGNINKTAFVQAVKSDKVKKILLIRHPFSRIASAYRDKLADRKAKLDGMHFFQRFGVHMNRKYRLNKKLIKQKEPTFEEFVDYLIDTEVENYEDHWKPISLLCGLCHVRYDHIIMTEGLKATSDFHKAYVGFSFGKFPKENVNSESYSSTELFRQISNSKKVKLLKKYQDDFRLFQYSFLTHYV